MIETLDVYDEPCITFHNRESNPPLSHSIKAFIANLKGFDFITKHGSQSLKEQAQSYQEKYRTVRYLELENFNQFKALKERVLGEDKAMDWQWQYDMAVRIGGELEQAGAILQWYPDGWCKLTAGNASRQDQLRWRREIPLCRGALKELYQDAGMYQEVQ